MTLRKQPPAVAVCYLPVESRTFVAAGATGGADAVQTDDAGALAELEASVRAEVLLPADAHVIGEPVTITQIRYPGLSRVGLLATWKRGDLTYELSLADVVFPAASATSRAGPSAPSITSG